MLLVMTFGVVLFTLLVQGTTIKRLLGIVGLAGTSETSIEHQRRQGRIISARAGRRELETSTRRRRHPILGLGITETTFTTLSSSQAVDLSDCTFRPTLASKRRPSSRSERISSTPNVPDFETPFAPGWFRRREHTPSPPI